MIQVQQLQQQLEMVLHGVSVTSVYVVSHLDDSLQVLGWNINQIHVHPHQKVQCQLNIDWQSIMLRFPQSLVVSFSPCSSEGTAHKGRIENT
jgi:hypothetical protein